MQFDDLGWLAEAIEIDYSDKSMSRNGYKPTHVVLHSTAGGSSAQGIANYFATGSEQASAHFVIGQDGTIVQGIPCSLAAWANGILNQPRLPFPPSINPNWYSISIEHVKPSTDNSDPLTEAQKMASFRLILALCQHYGIPARQGDATSGVVQHADFDSVSRARCPGTYPSDELWKFLERGGKMLPNGWVDDGTTLKYGSFVVVAGFRRHVLAGLQDGSWRGDDTPCENEHPANPLEYSNTALKPGNKQRFKYTILEWNEDRGVFPAYAGPELIKLEQMVTQLDDENNRLKIQNAILVSGSLPSDMHQIYQLAAKYEAKS